MVGGVRRMASEQAGPRKSCSVSEVAKPHPGVQDGEGCARNNCVLCHGLPCSRCAFVQASSEEARAHRVREVVLSADPRREPVDGDVEHGDDGGLVPQIRPKPRTGVEHRVHEKLRCGSALPDTQHRPVGASTNETKAIGEANAVCHLLAKLSPITLEVQLVLRSRCCWRGWAWRL